MVLCSATNFMDLSWKTLKLCPLKWMTVVSQDQQKVNFLWNLSWSKFLTRQITFFAINLILQVIGNTLEFYFNLKINPNHSSLLIQDWDTVQNVAHCQENNLS